MVVQENGNEGPADILKEWLANKDQNLREREPKNIYRRDIRHCCMIED
jgi:hypothetical protein